MNSQVIVVGDIHAEWSPLNSFLNKKRPEMVLQTGDFGFWPRIPKFDIRLLKPKNTGIHWCDGNHEDHWSLKDRSSNEIIPNVFFQPRGSVLTLSDGRNVLFFGGAHSVDKDMRQLGYDWFPEEIPSYVDFEQLDKIKVKIDIVISHTCPNEFEIEKGYWSIPGSIREKIADPTRDLLSVALEMFRPSLWYFGHWHIQMRGEYKECHWRAMNMCPENNWWMALE